MVAWVAVCYAVAVVAAVAFSIYAVAFGWFWTKRHGDKVDTEMFLTARGTQSLWRIGWSFYAGAIGAWAIVSPSQYASFAGIVGLVVYALAAGLPIIITAAFGALIKRTPHVMSLADYVGMRFGPIAKTMVFAICMFNMSIALLAEYTTIGSIFADYVGSVSYGIILVVGALTLGYTAYGGLAVSIATDQVQGIASALLAVVLVIYVAVTYRTPLPQPLPESLGPNLAGYVSVFTLGSSLVASTMFSEAVWQRVWASANGRALHGGAALGCIAVTLLVFLSGFGGWLAWAGGYATADSNPNTYLMQILTNGPPGSGPATVHSWVGVVVVLLAVIINEGAVDSLQNGLASSLSGHFLKNRPLLWTRVAVVVLNVPLIALGARGYSVLSLFLVANLLTCCAVVPLMAGLLPGLRRTVSETGFVLSAVGGILGVTAVGIGVTWDATLAPAEAIAAGANWAWYGNGYDWRAFLAALLCSGGVLLLWTLTAAAAARCGVHGPGISGLLMRLPGMRAITATPVWPPTSLLPLGADGAAGPQPPSPRPHWDSAADLPATNTHVVVTAGKSVE